MSVFAALDACRKRNEPAVLVTIAAVQGSAPRGVGTRMLVTAAAQVGTIGGGALENAALEHARQLLQDDPSTACVEAREWTLGKALSQCCGGRVSLHFDRVPMCEFRIEVFGAGHVAQQIASIARQLPCVARFHDSRAAWLQRIELLTTESELDESTEFSAPAVSPAEGVLSTCLLGANVYAAVEACSAGAYYLVMTHSHELDLDVVEAVLTRGDAAFCGLIASRSKAHAFRSRLLRKGFSEMEVAGLTAPLGSKLSTGNTPMEVAVAAISDVLDARGRPEKYPEMEATDRVTALRDVVARQEL